MAYIKKHIAWISVPAFISTDRFIIPELSKQYDIDWYLITKESEKIDFYETITELSIEYGFHLEILTIRSKNSSLKTAQIYMSFLHGLKSQKYDLIYNIMIGIPYYMPLFRLLIGNKKALIAVHNVHVPKGGSAYLPSVLYTNYTIMRFKYFQTFSASQKRELIKKAPRKYCENVDFVLMDYGDPTIKKEPYPITFLSFGIIREYKRVDVIIQAAEEAYENTGKIFKVIIAGGCSNWDVYQKLIKHAFLFDLRIRRIEDDEVPNLFEESHYFLAPYQDIAQSGSAIIAVNYNLPIIASKLEAFESYIVEGRTGYLISPASKEELKEVMIKVLNNHEKDYKLMRETIMTEKEKRFSAFAVAKLYTTNFEYVLMNNSKKQ